MLSDGSASSSDGSAFGCNESSSAEALDAGPRGGVPAPRVIGCVSVGCVSTLKALRVHPPPPKRADVKARREWYVIYTATNAESAQGTTALSTHLSSGNAAVGLVFMVVREAQHPLKGSKSLQWPATQSRALLSRR